MSETQPQQQKKLSAADAAKRVKRRIVETDKAGVERERFVPVDQKEVLAFRDYGTHVVVVTIDGQKFSSAEAEAA